MFGTTIHEKFHATETRENVLLFTKSSLWSIIRIKPLQYALMITNIKWEFSFGVRGIKKLRK